MELENESTIETTGRVARNKALFVLEQQQTEGTHMTDERKTAHHYLTLSATTQEHQQQSNIGQRHRRTDLSQQEIAMAWYERTNEYWQSRSVARRRGNGSKY